MHGVRAWETTERLLESGRYEARQRALVSTAVVDESEAGARWLGVAYWDAIARFTRGAVRAGWSDDGGKLRLLGGAVLLTFTPAELAVDEGGVSCTHAIRGGFLTLRTGGSVALAQRKVGSDYELSVTVEEYLPRLGGPLYGRGQSPFHAALSRRYFKLLEQRAVS
jgi:hypothetical protein